MLPGHMSTDNYDPALSRGADTGQHWPYSHPGNPSQRTTDSLPDDASYSNAEDFYRTFALPAAAAHPQGSSQISPHEMTSSSRQRPFEPSGSPMKSPPPSSSSSNPSSRSGMRSASGPATSQATSFHRPPVRNLVDRFNQSTSPPSNSLNAPARYRSRASLGASPSPSSSRKASSSTDPSSMKDGDAAPNKLYKPHRTTPQYRYPHALGPVSGDMAAALGRRNIGMHGDLFQQSSGSSAALQQSPPSRPLLFGEVLVDPNGVQELGYGIPAHRGHVRRGSEGSMHLPNVMYSRGRTESRDQHSPIFSPSRPQNLFLGDDLPPHTLGHRKSRSETYGAYANPTVDVPSFGPNSSPISPTHRRRESPRSKIPVPARRARTNSDSSSSAPSRAASAMSEARYTSDHPPEDSMLPTSVYKRSHNAKGSAGHGNPQSPSKSPPRLAARRYGDAHERPSNGGASLKAVIHAPVLKTSPPLRKSRSRQPLSSATGSGSPSRASESSKQQSGHRTLHKDPHTRRSPSRLKKNVGLGGENFAARKTLFESGSQDNPGRSPKSAAHAKRKAVRKDSQPSSSLDSLPDAGHGAPVVDVRPPTAVKEHEPHLGDSIENIAKLTLNTTSLPEPSGEQPLTGFTEFDESPVFGTIPGQFPEASPDLAQETPQAGSGGEESKSLSSTPQPNIGAFVTFLDEESPVHQDEHAAPLPQPNPTTLLGQVMKLRAESPSAASQAGTEFAEDHISEPGDDATIQIMLGATPAFANLQGQWDAPQQQSPQQQHDPQDYLSTPSWTRAGHSNPEEGISFIDDESESPIDPFSRSPALPAATYGEGMGEVRDSVLEGEKSEDTVNRQLSSSIALDPTSPADLPIQTPGPTSSASPRDSAKKLNQRVHLVASVFDSYLRSDETVAPDLAQESQRMVGQEFGENVAHLIDWHTRDSAMSFLESLLKDLEEEAIEKYGKVSPPIDASAPTQPALSSLPKPDSRQPRYMDFEGSPDPNWTPGTAIIYGSSPWKEERASRISELPPALPEIAGTGEGLGLAIRVTPPEDSSQMPSPPQRPAHSPPPPPPPPSSDKPANHTPDQSGGAFSPPTPSMYSTTTDGARRITQPFQYPQVPYQTYRINGQSYEISPPPPPPPPLEIRRASLTDSIDPNSEMGKQLTNRIRVIKEIVSSEDSLKQDFTVLCGIWIESSRVLLTDEQREIIFGNAAEVLELVEHLDKAFKEAAKPVYVMEQSSKWLAESKRDSSPKPEVIKLDPEADRATNFGAVILRNRDRIERVYSKYLKNNPNSARLISTLVKDPKFQQWQNLAKEQSKDLTYAWDLNSMLVKPLQRLTKYPLLLKELLGCTPADHPDRPNLENALNEIISIANKINNEQKRHEVLEQALIGRRKGPENKQKGSLALTRAFGRRTEKFKQQVGLTDTVDDPEYDAVAQKFGGHFFQLQIVMRDVEKYLEDVTNNANQCLQVVAAMDSFVEIPGRGRSNHPWIESKWRKYAQAVREIATVALPEHRQKIQKQVVEPIQVLWKLHDTPQLMMQKRKKRITDYTRYKAMKEAGEKPEKKIVEAGEQWEAINETLKLELPKLYALTKKLVEACIKNLIDLQLEWNLIWQKKIESVIDKPRLGQRFSVDLSDITRDFHAEYDFTANWLLELAICNRTTLVETTNFLSPPISSSSSLTAAPESETPPFRIPLIPSSGRRTQSIGSEKSIQSVIWSPVPPHTGSLSPTEPKPQLSPTAGNHRTRARTNSSASNRGGSITPKNGGLPPLTTANGFFSPPRPSTAQGRAHEPPPVSFNNNPSNARVSQDSPGGARPPTSSTYHSDRQNSYNGRSSSIFSSAMPMSDSPSTTRPETPEDQNQEQEVLFLAASLFEFNIAHDRREGGIPYLVYAPGEIFDVIGEKGELWLAINQDDPQRKVGWIWEKHFARILPDTV